METFVDICGDGKCGICAETLSSPKENVRTSSEEITPAEFGNSTKTNKLFSIFLQCLNDDESYNDDLDTDIFDTDEAHVIFCTRCQTYLTQWDDLNNQINLLQLRANQIKFTLCALVLMAVEKLKETELKNPAFDDTSLRPNCEKTAENTFISHENAPQDSFKNLVQTVTNRICNRFNVEVLLRKCPVPQAQSCNPPVTVTRPQLTCVTVATDKYAYADKYTFVFKEDKFRCAECSAAFSKKCDMLRHIRLKHICANETETNGCGMKNHENIFINKVKLNVSQTEAKTGDLESEECDLDEAKIASASTIDVVDIDRNDFQDDADGDWNASVSHSEGSDSEADPMPSARSTITQKTSRLFRPRRTHYTPAEDGSVMDPYGHLLKQTGPKEFLYASEHKFRFQNGRYHCDLCQYTVLKRMRMLKHIRLQHMNPPENEVKFPISRPVRPIGPALDLGKFQVILTPNGKWKCGECNIERNRKKDIRYHIRRLHIEKGSKKSDQIQSYSWKEVRPNEYLYHDKFPFRFDAREGVFVCGICDHKSSLKRSMMPHIRAYHFSEEEKRLHSAVEVGPGEFLYAGKYKIFFADGRYSCGICGWVKEMMRELYPHIKKYHFPGPNPDEAPVNMETEHVINVDKPKTDAAAGTTDSAGKILGVFTASATSRSRQSAPVARRKKMAASLPLPDPITGRIDLEYKGIPFSYESAINKWTCSLCPIVKADRNKMSEHIRQKHINPEHFVCDICGFESNDRSSFYRHQARHQGARFKCHLCDKKFADRAYLQRHLSIHKGEEGKKFQCEFWVAVRKNPLARILPMRIVPLDLHCICTIPYKIFPHKIHMYNPHT